MARRALLPALLLAFLVSAAPAARADAGLEESPSESPPAAPTVLPPELPRILLQGFMGKQDVVERLLALDPKDWPTLPPPGALILADALTRRGDVRNAARVYTQVLQQAGDQPAWANSARSALGWIALAQGDPDGIRRYFGPENGTGPNSLARVLLALTDAADARPGAPAALEGLALDASLGTVMQDVARLGVGYAYFWAGDYVRSENAFAHVGAEGRFADDAEYGAAWSRFRAGDEARARASLAQVAARSTTGSRRRPSHKLVELQPSAVLRAGLQGYRTLHVATDEMWLADMLDVDGPRLARAALKLVDRSARARPSAATGAEATRAEVSQPGVSPTSAPRPTAGASPSAASEARGPADSDRDWVAWLLAFAFLAAVAAVFRARRTPLPRR